MNEKLNNLIRLAQGNRSQNTFAMKCGINSGTITRILKGENNPKPDLLKKIAANAHNGVTYNDLMIAAGFLDEEPLLYVPENVRNIPIAFSGGLEDLTQEDLNEVSNYIEYLKNRKKNNIR